MPYMDPSYNSGGMGIVNPNFNWNQIERMNNRINRLERQVRILENRVNRLSSNPSFLKNEYDDNDNMYML